MEYSRRHRRTVAAAANLRDRVTRHCHRGRAVAAAADLRGRRAACAFARCHRAAAPEDDRDEDHRRGRRRFVIAAAYHRRWNTDSSRVMNGKPMVRNGLVGAGELGGGEQGGDGGQYG
ncbi:unnamed protein product [Ectocarpus sp. CCAP 1310/34]|nr:unnamed protein product [Ectocarpus sp. CCAP 1310/34]